MNALEQLKGELEGLLLLSDQAYPDDDSMRAGYSEGLEEALRELNRVMHPVNPKEDIVRVVRIYEFSGPRSVIEKQMASSVQQEKEWGNGCTIKAATLGMYPEILYPVKEPT